ncbi:MAG: hypothetical protein V3U75_06125 [Methylococcaceae bacterium]
MKCFYYLTGTLESTRKISDNLQNAGIDNWFIHVLSKDEAGLKKDKIHSSNYFEQLDILRYGIIGAAIGFLVALIAVALIVSTKLFGPDMPNIVYYAMIAVLTLFGSWEGGLIGIASENKKIKLFNHDLELGKFLILIYSKKDSEDRVKKIMVAQHPEAQLVAVDANFYNPLTNLKRL